MNKILCIAIIIANPSIYIKSMDDQNGKKPAPKLYASSNQTHIHISPASSPVPSPTSTSNQNTAVPPNTPCTPATSNKPISQSQPNSTNVSPRRKSVDEGNFDTTEADALRAALILTNLNASQTSTDSKSDSGNTQKK